MHTTLISLLFVEEANRGMTLSGEFIANNQSCHLNSPSLEKRHLRDIFIVNKSSPIFAIYPDPIMWKDFVSDQYYEILNVHLIEKMGWQVYSENLPHIDVLLMVDMNPSVATFNWLEQVQKLGQVTHFLYWVDDVHYMRYSMYEIKHQTYSLPYLNLVGPGACHHLHTFYSDIDFTNRTFWVPHGVSERFRIKLNESAFPKVLLTGKTGAFYPYRGQAHKLMRSGNRNIAQLKHPGYNNKLSTSFYTDYVSKVTEYSTGLTSSLILHYVVAKVFEIPAMGQLLLINHEIEPLLNALCLYPNIHFLSYSKKSMSSVIQRAVHKNFASQNLRIRRAAQSVVIEMHTTEARAQLVTQIAVSLVQEQKAPHGFSLLNNAIAPTLHKVVAAWFQKLKTDYCRKSELAKQSSCLWPEFRDNYS